MGAKWNSAVEAKAHGSLCNFQLALSFSFALPIPPLPKIPALPKLPTINLFCPFDERPEKKLE